MCVCLIPSHTHTHTLHHTCRTTPAKRLTVSSLFVNEVRLHYHLRRCLRRRRRHLLSHFLPRGYLRLEKRKEDNVYHPFPSLHDPSYLSPPSHLYTTPLISLPLSSLSFLLNLQHLYVTFLTSYIFLTHSR